MARSFNGTTDVAVTNYPTGIIITQLSLSMWLYIPAYKNPAFGCAITYDQPNAVQQGMFFVLPSVSAAGVGWLGFSDSNAVNYWADAYPQPSAGAWHHYLYVLDRTNPSNALWIDGVAQVLTVVVHNGAAYGGFRANGQVYLGAESNTGTNPQAMRICELGMVAALWTQRHATALANGASFVDMGIEGHAMYTPLGGYDSPEPRWDGPHPVPPPANIPIHFNLTGTTFARNPAVIGATVGRRLAF